MEDSSDEDLCATAETKESNTIETTWRMLSKLNVDNQEQQQAQT